MARCIEATPPVTGEDADILLDSLESVASPEEIGRRRSVARAFLAGVETPKLAPHYAADHASLAADKTQETP